MKDTIVLVNWRDRDHPLAGGAETYCEEVASRLAANGSRLVFLTSKVEGRPVAERRDGYEVVRRGGRLSVYLWAGWWLTRHRSEVGSVIDADNGIPFFTPLFVPRRVPVVLLLFHVHQEQFARYFPGPVAVLGRWLEATATRWAYKDRPVAAISPSTREGARRRLGLRGPIYVVAPGWSGSEICPKERDMEKRAPFPRIVCVGRLVAHKRYELLIGAMPELLRAHPDLMVDFVGDGPELGPLKALALALGVGGSVRFHGPVPMGQRDALMQTAWITANLSEGEGWGLTVLEANAMGVPALAFDVPGLRDSVRAGRTGWLIDEGDSLADGIAAALSEVRSPEAAARWGHRAQLWARSFNWGTATQLLWGVLEAERGRRTRTGSDRRELTDLGTVARLATGSLDGASHGRLRATDHVVVGDKQVVVLFPGCDGEEAMAALRRVGVVPTNRDAVDVEVARPLDYLVPGGVRP